MDYNRPLMNGGSPIAAREILRTGAWAALLTLAGAVAYYGPAIALGSRLFFTHDVSHSDVWHLNFPIKLLYDQALARGELPLWCPELGSGFPLLAQGQVGALYPLNLLLYGALPLVLAFNWSVLLHAALAGGFAAMLARELGAGRAGSFLSAVVFAFCGFFVVHVKHVSMTAAAVWMPLLLLLVERFARGARAVHVVLLAAVTAVVLLAGHPQIAYYALLVTAGWAAVRLVSLLARPLVAIVFGCGLAYALLLGALLAAPQLLPTRELNSLGPRRAGLTLEEATEWRYEWAHLALFVRPHALGDPGKLEGPPPVEGKSLFWETTGYVGLLPLLLAAACLALARQRRAVALLLGLLALSLLLALGPAGGLFYLFWKLVPGFTSFRFQSRFLLFADLALALLAGLGLTFVADRLGPRLRGLGAWAIPAIVVLACFADLKLALGDHNPTIEARRWLAKPPSAARIEREEAGRHEPFRIVGNDPQRAVFKSAYFRARGWQGDLAPYDAPKTMLSPNLSAVWGLDNFEIFFPLYPQWQGDAARLLRAPASLERPDPQAATPGYIHAGFASLFNVRYVLDAFGFELPDSSHLESYPAGELEIRLLENRGAFPRAFLVPGARMVVNRPVGRDAIPEAVRALFAPGFDPRREVVLVEGAGEPAPRLTPPGEPLLAPVTFLSYRAHEVRLRVDAPRDGWLVLSDTYYPGWSATVNGVSTSIQRANVSMRAIPLDAGPAEVVFRYRPDSFRHGLLLALAGALLLATLPLEARVWRAWRRR